MTKLNTLIQFLKLTNKRIKTKHKIKYSILLLSAIILTKKIFFTPKTIQQISIPLSQFLIKLDKGQIKKVLLKKDYTYFLDNKDKLYKAFHYSYPKSELFKKLSNAKVEYQSIREFNFPFINFLFAFCVSALAAIGINYLLNGNIFKKESKEVQKIQYTFSNIIGLQDCKISLKQVIDFMKNPQRYQQSGARMRKGIIFYGPSGTGKTSLAKACAGQAGVPFFSCNAAQFKQMYVGMGAKKIRQLFQQARNVAPSIIYIDQIDAMGNRNSGGLSNFDGASSQKNTTINQLLSQLDGFNSSKTVLVIGSTNKIDLLDQALLRPGRFDLKIKVNLPNQKDKFEILCHYLKNKKHNLNEQFLRSLVQKLKGWSGAHIQNLANQAVYFSLRRNGTLIQTQDIQNALKTLDN